METLIRDGFSTLFQNVVLGNLKLFLQLDQVDVSLHLTEAIALHYSRGLASLSPSRCPTSRLWASHTAQSIPLHSFDGEHKWLYVIT